MAIPDLTAETLMPIKGVKLSAFARMVWGIGLVIVLSIGWLVYSKFDIDRLRGADHFIDQARHAVDAKDWPAALSAIQKVDGEVRTRPDFLQLVADYLKGTHTEPALLASTLAKLDEAGHLREEDFLWLCRASLGAGNVRGARAALDRVPERLRSKMEGWELSVAVLHAEGREDEAEEAEKQLSNRFPDHPKIAIYRAMHELDGTFPEIRQAARERLWKIAEVPDEHGLRALRAFGTRSDLSNTEVRRLKTLVDQHPAATPEDSFNAASKMLRAFPALREEAIATEIKRHPSHEPESLSQLAAWLAREKEYTRIMKLIPTNVWENSPDLFPAVAQGLAQQGKWDELSSLLKQGKKLPVSDARASGWRALAARHLSPDDPAEAQKHLIEAVQKGEAGNDSPALLGAAMLAEEWGMADLALKAYQKLADQETPQEAEMLEKCWQMANILKEAGTLMKIAGRLAKLRPDNFLLLKRQDYLRLLCGREMEVALTTASNLRDTDAATLMLRALKSYRMQDLKGTSQALDKIKNISELSAGERAVYAGLMVKVRGDASRAFEVAEKILPQLLLPEESAFLKMAL